MLWLNTFSHSCLVMRDNNLKFSKRATRVLAAGLAILIGPLSARAATAPHAATYDVWPIEDSSAPNAVTSMIQTRDGYLWIGTYQGLMRYDGVRFTLFDTAHTRGLHNNRITALYQDRQDTLWIGHETGQMTQLQDGHFQPAELGQGWPGGAIEW